MTKNGSQRVLPCAGEPRPPIRRSRLCKNLPVSLGEWIWEWLVAIAAGLSAITGALVLIGFFLGTDDREQPGRTGSSARQLAIGGCAVLWSVFLLVAPVALAVDQTTDDWTGPAWIWAAGSFIAGLTLASALLAQVARRIGGRFADAIAAGTVLVSGVVAVVLIGALGIAFATGALKLSSNSGPSIVQVACETEPSGVRTCGPDLTTVAGLCNGERSEVIVVEYRLHSPYNVMSRDVNGSPIVDDSGNLMREVRYERSRVGSQSFSCEDFLGE